jgi:PAS domain S-box-containing protein
MQSVSDRWYIRYSRISLALAIALAVTVIIGQIFPDIIIEGQRQALSFLALGLAIMQILYITIIFNRAAKSGNIWQSSFILYLLQTITAISLIHTSGEFGSMYMTIWVIIALISGMFGVYAIIGMCFVITLYFILASTGSDGIPSFDTPGLVGLIGTYILGFLSYLIFKKYYDLKTNSQITKLSGALKNKQLQSEILVQSITDGVVVTDNEGSITVMNSSASKLTGWQYDESLGINVHNVVTFKNDQDEVIPNTNNPFDLVITSKKPINNTYKLESRDKTIRSISCVVSPIVADNSNEIVGTVAVMRDVSTEKAEEQRRADFISTASHEMRTPVAAIEGYLALALNDKVSKVDAKARSYLEKAHASTQHLGKLFQDLLTSAKAEDGRLVSHPSVMDMGLFLEQVADSLRFSAEKKGLFVEYTIGTSSGTTSKVLTPLYYAYADPDRVREVITNIFDNAVKYTDTGKISIGLTGNDDVVQFFVKDTGPGISKEDIPHLFQKFYRVDNTNTRTVGGTGLGLFICKKIIEIYNGRIWVESEVGKGSTFYINLPRISSQKARDIQNNSSSSPPNS